MTGAAAAKSIAKALGEGAKVRRLPDAWHFVVSLDSIAVAAIADLSTLVTVDVPQPGEPRPRHAHWQIETREKLNTSVGEIAGTVAAWRAHAAGASNVIDAAVRVRDAVADDTAIAAAAPGGLFMISMCNEPAGASIDLAESDTDLWRGMVWLELHPRGVAISVPSERAAGPLGEATSPAQVQALLPEVVAAVRQRLADRFAFLNRPFGVTHAARALAEALSRVRPPQPTSGWRVEERCSQFPNPSPYAAVRWGPEADQIAAWFREEGGAVHLWAGGIERHVHDRDELAAMIPTLVDAIIESFHRLTAHRLAVGSRYRVLRDMPVAAAGDVLRYTGKVFGPDDYRYDFCRESDGADICLFEDFDEHLAILRELHVYIESMP